MTENLLKTTLALCAMLLFGALPASAKTYFQAPNQNQRCQILEGWVAYGLQGDINVRAGRNVGYWSEYPRVFHRQIFTEFFGTDYPSLSEKQKDAIERDLRTCSGFSDLELKWVTMPFWTENTGLKDKGRANRMVQLNEAREYNQLLNEIDRVRSRKPIDGWRRPPAPAAALAVSMHRRGPKIFENDLLAVYRSTDDYKEQARHGEKSGWGCRSEAHISVDLKVNRSFVITRPFVYDISQEYIAPAAQRICPGLPVVAELFIAGVVVDVAGRELSMARAMERPSYNDRPIVYARVKSTNGPFDKSNVNIIYQGSQYANIDRHYDEFVQEVGSLDAWQAFEARGGKTRAQIAAKMDADRNPDWPLSVAAQISYISRGDFNPALAQGATTKLPPQRAGKLIHSASDYKIHEFRDHRGVTGCFTEKNGKTRLQVTVIRSISLTARTTEQWMWNTLRPELSALAQARCPRATGAIAHIYVKGVDMTSSGMSYPVSQFPTFLYNSTTNSFTSTVKGEVRPFPKENFPTMSVASAYFTFVERMPQSQKASYLKQAKNPTRRNLYDHDDLSWFSQDRYLRNTFTLNGGDGSFLGLLEHRREQAARYQRATAERKRREEAQMALILGFIGGLDSYIDWSSCHPRANDIRSMSRPSLACQEKYPDLRSGANPYRP